MEKGKKKLVLLIVLVGILTTIYLGTGFFVIQPIGAIPEGKTIWYIRMGLKLPFISSADGMLIINNSGVSLFGRAMMMSSILELINGKTLLKLPYSKVLYKISTNGVEFEQ